MDYSLMHRVCNRCMACSDLCRSIYLTYSSMSATVLNKFDRRAETAMPSYCQSGVGTHDAFLDTSGPRAVQKKKSPANNCYVRIPIEMQWDPPDWARLQLKKLLGTTFVDSDGYVALVNMNSLVFGEATQAMCMLIP